MVHLKSKEKEKKFNSILLQLESEVVSFCNRPPLNRQGIRYCIREHKSCECTPHVPMTVRVRK